MAEPNEEGSRNPPNCPKIKTEVTTPKKSDDIGPKRNKIKIDDDVEIIELVHKPIVIDDDDNDDMPVKIENLPDVPLIEKFKCPADVVPKIEIKPEATVSKETGMACLTNNGETREPDVSHQANNGENGALETSRGINNLKTEAPATLGQVNNGERSAPVVSYQTNHGETRAPDYIPIEEEPNVPNTECEIDISEILQIYNLDSMNLNATKQLCGLLDPDDLMSLLDEETKKNLSQMEISCYVKIDKSYYTDVVKLMGIETNVNLLVDKLWNNSSVITNPFMRFWPTDFWFMKEEDSLCKVLCIKAPHVWTCGHIKALLDIGTTFDSNARQILIRQKNIQPSKRTKKWSRIWFEFFLIRFQSRKECELVYDQLKCLKLNFSYYDVIYDIGYKMAQNTHILRNQFKTMGAKDNMILEGIDKCRKQLIEMKELEDILKEYLQKKSINAVLRTNATQNADLINDCGEIDSGDTSSTSESEEHTVSTFIQLSDESDENHCRIIRISNIRNIELIKNDSEESWNIIDVKQVSENEAVAICQTHAEAKEIVEEMNGTVVDGCKIEVQLDVGHVASRRRIDSDIVIKQEKEMSDQLKYKDPRINVFSMSRLCQVNLSTCKNDYELSKSFFSDSLRSPYTNCVTVKNLHPEITENQVRKIFALAGVVKGIKIEKDYAKIFYDHPLEAVQAISMFNKQIIFNEIVQVNMVKTTTQERLPFGLQSIGPGLGKSGEPLANLRAVAEIREIKKALSDRCRMEKIYQLDGPFIVDYEVSSPIVSDQGQQTVETGRPVVISQTKYIPSPVRPNIPIIPNRLALPRGQVGLGNLIRAVNQASRNHWEGSGCSIPPPYVATPRNLYQQRPAQYIPQPLYQYPNNPINWQRENIPPASTFASPSLVPNNPPPISVPFPRSFPNITHRPVLTNPGNQSGSPVAAVTQDLNVRKRKYDEIARGLLSFSNLPTSVSADDLRRRVMEIGEVGLCEITGRGRAIVRFKNPNDAERCISLFDRSKVNGQNIDVNYI